MSGYVGINLWYTKDIRWLCEVFLGNDRTHGRDGMTIPQYSVWCAKREIGDPYVVNVPDFVVSLRGAQSENKKIYVGVLG